MAMRLKKQCLLRAQSNLRSSTVASLGNINKLNPSDFFAENYFTKGMVALCDNGFKRLSGKTGVSGFYRLTESMGGGKTHNLLAFGLMAKDAEARATVLAAAGQAGLNQGFGDARILAFEGYQTPQNGIWGDLAAQIGSPHALEAMRPYYKNGLQAPGQSVWVEMLKAPDGSDAPTVILLDELPVYLHAIGAQMAGSVDLASVTSIALSNLIMAVDNHLPNVVLVMTDLNSSSWQQGSNQLQSAINAAGNLGKQSERTAMPILPVQMNTDEIYHILRKRIFDSVGTQAQIKAVQDEFGQHVNYLKSIGVSALVASKAGQYASQISDSYPFHPSIRDLFGRFKENEGFQQTRGILRMMQSIAARVYQNGAVDPWLIGAEVADLNDPEVLSSYNNANANLITSIASDVSSQGSAVAEIGSKISSTALASNVANTVLFASLAKGAGQAALGLTSEEIEAILSEPGRDQAIIKESIAYIEGQSTYVHHDANSRMFYRENKNIVSEVKYAMQQCPQSLVDKQVEEDLRKAFNPINSSKFGSPYQELLIFPDASQIQAKTTWNRSALAIIRPDEWDKINPYTSIQQLVPLATALYASHLPGASNKLLMLSLDHTAYATYKARVKEAIAYDQVIQGQIALGVNPSDPALTQARKALVGIKANVQQAFKSLPSHLILPFGGANFQPVSTSSFMGNAPGGQACGHSLVWETLMAKGKVPSPHPLEWVNDLAVVDKEVKRFNAKVFTMPSIQKSQLEKLAADCMAWTWCTSGVFQKFVAHALATEAWREDKLQDAYVKMPAGGWPPALPEIATVNHTSSMSPEKKLGQTKIEIKLSGAEHYEMSLASSASAWTKHELAKERFLTLEDPWVRLRAYSEATSQTSSEIVVFNENIAVEANVLLQGSQFNVSFKIIPAAAQPLCSLAYTTDGSAPANAGVKYPGPLPGHLSLPSSIPMLLVLPSFVDPDGQEKALAGGRHQAIALPAAAWSKAKPAMAVPQSKPTRYIGGNQINKSGEIAKCVMLLRAKKAMIKGVSIDYTIGGDWANVSFPSSSTVSPDTIEKITKILSSELNGVMDSLKFEEILFQTGADMMEFAQKHSLEVAPQDWQELGAAPDFKAFKAESENLKNSDVIEAKSPTLGDVLAPFIHILDQVPRGGAGVASNRSEGAAVSSLGGEAKVPAQPINALITEHRDEDGKKVAGKD